MLKVYTHENRLMVWNARNLLVNEGISCEVLNKYSSGGVGDLSAFDAWPQLWIINESDLLRSEAVLDTLNQPDSGRHVKCQGCGESNPESFEVCWSCLESILS